MEITLPKNAAELLAPALKKNAILVKLLEVTIDYLSEQSNKDSTSLIREAMASCEKGDELISLSQETQESMDRFLTSFCMLSPILVLPKQRQKKLETLLYFASQNKTLEQLVADTP